MRWRISTGHAYRRSYVEIVYEDSAWRLRCTTTVSEKDGNEETTSYLWPNPSFLDYEAAETYMRTHYGTRHHDDIFILQPNTQKGEAEPGIRPKPET